MKIEESALTYCLNEVYDVNDIKLKRMRNLSFLWFRGHREGMHAFISIEQSLPLQDIRALHPLQML